VDVPRLIAAALPLVAGVLFLWRRGAPQGAQRFTVVGYGLFLAMLAWGVVLRGVDALGLRLDFGLLVAIAAVAVVLAALVPARATTGDAPVPGFAPDRVRGALLVLLLALLAARLLGLFLEVWWRPLYPWDALMHWATKARVWFEYRELLPFETWDVWAAGADPRVFTDRHPHYPATIPLLQLWMAISLGRWDPSLVNLPWVVCYVALGTAFYGQARQAGVSAVLALLFTYLVLSMPLLNSHVALAGYADLYVGTAYVLSLMALHSVVNGGPAWHGWLLFLCAASLPLLKQEGLFWLLTLAPALLAARWRRAWVVPLLLLLLVVVIALVLWLFPRDLPIGEHSLDSLRIYYREGALPAVARSILLLGNWHVGPWLLLALLGLALLQRRLEPALLPVASAVASALLLYLFLFTFTKFAGGAVKQTAVGRIGLHLMPACLFLSLLLYASLSRRQRTPGDD
jgi:hypothetical protein